MRSLLLLLCACAVAHADDGEAPAPKVRPFHGSIAAGGGAMFGSHDRWAGQAAIDVLPGGAFETWGVTFAARDVTYSPFANAGMATIGVIREAAGARPLLAVFFHADAGVAWGEKTVPVVGGGVKTYLAFVGPLGVALDTTLHLEVNGIDGTHLVLGFGLMAAVIR
ncbi:MAG TPA: hypothetical protein VL463_28355 [Kofleriaceae bacterium]|nr:hypothetical protein [Kofleriaceae bacterium]